MKKFIFIAALFICIGCMPTYQVVRHNMPKFEIIDLATYDIGQIQGKNVGEAMLIIVDATAIIYDGYKAVKSYQPPDYVGITGMVTKFPPINEGSDWTLYGTIDSGDLIYASDTFPEQNCIVSNATNDFYGITGCNYFYVLAWPKKISGLLKPSGKITKYKEGSFKQELVYNGKSKDTIKVQYREYKDNFARPAFFHELTYDLTESKEIGFRGMIIEVLEATNSKIKFIVKSKMN
ncbi:MAG: hypothetical protein FJ241_01025 [Nitrospira sp.]|nr:hypothetical protein [Nitrospira sp.]